MSRGVVIMSFVAGHLTHQPRLVGPARRHRTTEDARARRERRAALIDDVKFVVFWALAVIGLTAVEVGGLYFMSLFR